MNTNGIRESCFLVPLVIYGFKQVRGRLTGEGGDEGGDVGDGAVGYVAGLPVL